MWVCMETKAGSDRWNVGFFSPDGNFYPEKLFESWQSAADFVNYLNGGNGRMYEYQKHMKIPCFASAAEQEHNAMRDEPEMAPPAESQSEVFAIVANRKNALLYDMWETLSPDFIPGERSRALENRLLDHIENDNYEELGRLIADIARPNLVKLAGYIENWGDETTQEVMRELGVSEFEIPEEVSQ